MTLADLVAQALGRRQLLPETQVTGVVQDHRRVRPGVVFVARQGGSADGHRFAKLAALAGAAAVVGQRPGVTVLPWQHVPYVHVDNDKIALAKLAAAFYGHPSRSLTTLGVTGTDGKTTVSFLLHHLLRAEFATGLLSTAGNRLNDAALDLAGHFTTPEAPEVQALLARFWDGGCSHAVVEASSHGLTQHRLDEISFETGVWTNLTPEHLDFHGTLEAYREAKLTLVRRARASVLNRDDDSFGVFAAASSAVLSYGEHAASDWRAANITTEPNGQRFQLLARTAEGLLEREVWLPLVGRYNVHNALAALAAAHAAGLDLDTLLGRLETFSGVPGRMEVVQGAPFRLVVDFAHTPAALQKLLQTLRPATAGRLIVVVGAAGERDPGKRQPLGRVAATYADVAVFTEEDSRSEATDAILAELLRGARGVGKENYRAVADRGEAIFTAVASAAPGDTVVLAGKGHERTLERAFETLPWDEVAEARRALLGAGFENGADPDC